MDGGSSTDESNILYAGLTDSGTAYNNKITINDTDEAGVSTLIAGESDQKAYGNEIDINSGTAASAIAGESTAADADSNILRIAGGNLSNGVAGSAASGAADSNEVYVTGGTTGSVTAGAGSTGASGNTVEISGDSTTVNAAIAGNGTDGAATGNSLTISGSLNVISATAGIGKTSASGNEASVSGGTAGTVIAGDSDAGTVSSNTMTVTGGTISGAYGGTTKSGTVSGNTLTVSGGTMTQGFGGYAFDTGTVTGNTASISSGTISQAIYGGYSNEGTASGNTVTVSGGSAGQAVGGYSSTAADNNKAVMTGGEVLSALAGGISPGGSVTGNTVSMSGGKAGRVSGGASTTTGGEAAVAKENSVTMSGGEAQVVIGGSSASSDAIDNTVLLSGGTASMIVGGGTSDGDAVSNEVTISSGTAGTVSGGYAGGGDVSENTVTINDGTITTSVAAGTSDSGNASGNTLNINGGTIGTEESSDESENVIAGGISDSGAATDNTVNVYAGMLGVMMSLYGGYSSTSSGNTLNMYMKANTVKNLGYFQAMNFYVPKGTTVGETMLTVTGTADVSGAIIKGGVDDSTKMNKGEYINLIYNANGVTTEGTQYGMIEGMDKVTDAGFVSQKVIAEKKDDNTIVLTIPPDDVAKIEPGTEAIPEDRVSSIDTINSGGDIAISDGLAAAIEAYRGAWLEDHTIEAKFAPYAVVAGHDLRHETGSYVDTHGFGLNTGFVRRLPRDKAIDTIMPFLEYGIGNYTSHLDDGSRGDGKQRYIGSGILLRRDQDDGLYYEGSVRAGNIDSDFHGIIDKHFARYDSGAPYIAMHAGLGKIFRRDRDDYDFYGKFFWTHLGSDSTTVTSDLGTAPYDFDTINSYRTRLGIRWKRNFDEIRAFYVGIGWDYEFNGTARAVYNGYNTPAPSIKGSSELLEVGWQNRATKEQPWGVDVRATGWTGRQEGITFSATISHLF